MANNVLQKPNGEILIYQAEDGTTKISVRFENGNLWLTQQQLGQICSNFHVPTLLNRVNTFMKKVNYRNLQPVGISDKFKFMHDDMPWRYRMVS